MTADSASENLRRYARDRDQAAFADLVRATAPLVWRVAMRRLGDAQLAEEAAQNVFVALARKAPALANRPGLTAWLHRAATLEASALARSRARRDQRHHAMARLIPSDSAPSPAAASPEPLHPAAGPWLDDALNRLSADDRSLLLGRFYEERSYRDLAQSLGKSEEAAKKQSQRALAKMEAILRRRGIGVSGLALTSLLGAELSPAAMPAHVTPSLVASTSAALASGAAAPSLITHFLLAMNTAKMTACATGVLLVLAAAAGWQANANASLRSDLRSLRSRIERDGTQRASGRPTKTAVSRHTSSVNTWQIFSLDAPSLVRAFLQSHPQLGSLHDNSQKLSDVFVADASAEKLWELVADLESVHASPAVLRQVREWLVTQIAKSDPQGAIAFALDKRSSDDTTEQIIIEWAKSDSEAAWRWLSTSRASGKLLRSRAGGRAPTESMLTGFAAGLSSLESDTAVAFVRGHLHEEGAQALVVGVGRSLVLNNETSQLLELVNALPTDETRRQALVGSAKVAIEPFAFDSSDAGRHLIPLLDHDAFPSALRNDVLRETAAAAPERSVWSALSLVDQASTPDQRADNLAWLAERFAKERPGEVSGYVTLSDAAQQARLDATLAATAEALAARGNARLAKEFAEKVRNEAVRTQTLNTVTK